MRDKDQNLIWESYLTELVGDPDDQRHGIPAARNIDADRRAAELRGPDPNVPKHGQSDANASDYDPNDSWQNKMRKAVQDLEDIPTNYTWSWTSEDLGKAGGKMHWLVKRLEFTNTREWDGTDRSMPDELQTWSGNDKKQVIGLLKNEIAHALHRSTGGDGTYANPEGGNVNPTELGKLAVNGIFDNGDSIRHFYKHWKAKREKEAEKEPSADEVRGVSPDKPEGFRLD